jgi:ribonuclease HII
MNVRAMRQAVQRLDPLPSYALTDGFPVTGMPVPTLAVWKGDRVAACVAAASVVAKVTRDRIMADLDREYPDYGFAVHKGYVVPEHRAALRRHGPCPEHRFSYVNVRGALIRTSVDEPDMVDTGAMDDLVELGA